MPLPKQKSNVQNVQSIPSTNRSLALNAIADTSAIRTEMFLDKEYLVVPVVALVEGVHHASNAPGPELALASEFGKWPQGWNGRPVVLNHPVEGSANSPEVLEKQAFGTLFNTELDGTKLKSEMWIDPERVEALGGVTAETVKRLEEGEFVEVSIGAYMAVIPGEGTFDGEDYEGIWAGIIPDHLALLPEGVSGACSIEDGCGAPRLNSALKGKPKGESADYETVDDLGVMTSIDYRKSFLRLFRRFGQMMFRYNRRELREPSDMDVRSALESAIEAQEPNAWIWVVAVFKESVVYERDGSLFEREFSSTDDGDVSLGSDIIAVRAITDFVPINAQAQEVSMTLQERVEALIQKNSSRFTESDREYLSGLTEVKLQVLEEVPEVVASEENQEPAKDVATAQELAEEAKAQESAELEAETAKPTEELKASTPEEYLKDAPEEIQEVLGQGLAMARAKKDGLIKALSENPRNAFTPEELQEMKIDRLEKLAKLANVPDFGARLASSQEEIEVSGAPKAPKVFPLEN